MHPCTLLCNHEYFHAPMHINIFPCRLPAFLQVTGVLPCIYAYYHASMYITMHICTLLCIIACYHAYFHVPCTLPCIHAYYHAFMHITMHLCVDNVGSSALNHLLPMVWKGRLLWDMDMPANHIRGKSGLCSDMDEEKRTSPIHGYATNHIREKEKRTLPKHGYTKKKSGLCPDMDKEKRTSMRHGYAANHIREKKSGLCPNMDKTVAATQTKKSGLCPNMDKPHKADFAQTWIGKPFYSRRWVQEFNKLRRCLDCNNWEKRSCIYAPKSYAWPQTSLWYILVKARGTFFSFFQGNAESRRPV